MLRLPLQMSQALSQLTAACPFRLEMLGARSKGSGAGRMV